MGRPNRRWVATQRSAAYRELDHPADLWLEIRGNTVEDLFENALFAFYDQTADLTTFEPRRQITLQVGGGDLPQALRNLLAEALFRFASERFVAISAEVSVSDSGSVTVTAHLLGENAEPDRHVLTTEIKAVTYHLLSVEKSAEDGAGGRWRATVLFDI